MRKSLLPLAIAALLGSAAAPAEDLIEVYRLALENDPQLRVARATLDSTREVRPIAASRLLPSLALGANAGQGWFHQGGVSSDSAESFSWQMVPMLTPLPILVSW